MTEAQKKLRDEAAENFAQFCHCAGPTCSGCEKVAAKLFKAGHDFAFERAKVLEEALELFANSFHQMTYGEITAKARAALAEYKGGRMFETETMSLETKAGEFVRFMNKNGHDHDLEQANKLLKPFDYYEVEWVDVGNWESHVKLKGIDETFNTVMFENAGAPSRQGDGGE